MLSSKLIIMSPIVSCLNLQNNMYNLNLISLFSCTSNHVFFLFCQTNMCVTSIDLSGNRIGRRGMECLVEMLDENMTITELVGTHG